MCSKQEWTSLKLVVRPRIPGSMPSTWTTTSVISFVCILTPQSYQIIMLIVKTLVDIFIAIGLTSKVEEQVMEAWKHIPRTNTIKSANYCSPTRCMIISLTNHKPLIAFVSAWQCFAQSWGMKVNPEVTLAIHLNSFLNSAEKLTPNFFKPMIDFVST